MSVTIQGDAPGQIEAACAIDGTTVLAAHDDAIVPGQLGFWAEEPGAVSFDDVVVRGNELPPPDPKEGTRNPRQRHDQHMKAWGNPAYAWQYDGISTQWWHRADFPGDVALESPVGGLSKFRLVVSAARGEPDSGYSFELDPATRRVCRAGQAIDLTPREYSLLEFLMRRAETIVTRAAIIEGVWDMNFDSLTNVLDVLVNRLRAKVDRPFATPLIHTVRSVGYTLSAKEH